MSEYIGAELAGRREGDCFKFERDCSRFDSKQFVKFLPQLFTAIQPFVCHQIAVQVEQVFKGGTGDNFHQYAN